MKRQGASASLAPDENRQGRRHHRGRRHLLDITTLKKPILVIKKGRSFLNARTLIVCLVHMYRYEWFS
ncbi:hypothetical protein [Mesorhizobium tianshanense]|uniref:hypothetical protein n=1 Tax=Mesorhizobium tianshanense TaxID=39844 RepID=UPI0011A247CC|nr:hypothetical protein [Mesorhizobium tianshanense]